MVFMGLHWKTVPKDTSRHSDTVWRRREGGETELAVWGGERGRDEPGREEDVVKRQGWSRPSLWLWR